MYLWQILQIFAFLKGFYFFIWKRNSNGQDLCYCDLNPFCLVKLFHYTDYNQNLKHRKPRDVKLILSNILLYNYHKANFGLLSGDQPHLPDVQQFHQFQSALVTLSTKWGLQDFIQALFVTTVFRLRLSLKCSWGSGGSCKLWLKQHSNLRKTLEVALFFVCDKWYNYCIVTSNIKDSILILRFHIYISTIFLLAYLSSVNTKWFPGFYQQLYARDAHGFQWYQRQ